MVHARFCCCRVQVLAVRSYHQKVPHAAVFKRDIFSLGVLIYAMLCGRLPFESGTVRLLRREMARCVVACRFSYSISNRAAFCRFCHVAVSVVGWEQCKRLGTGRLHLSCEVIFSHATRHSCVRLLSTERTSLWQIPCFRGRFWIA